MPRTTSGPIVGTLARLDAIKGLDILLRALAELPGVTAVLVGEGEERDRLAKLAEALGVAERVLFVGWSEQARDHLTTFDVYVLPSRFEAVSASIIEAMFAGLPVVATNVGGVRDVVVHGETGLLVPPEDPAALARAVRGLLEDPTRRQQMGRAGRARAVERFTAASMAAQYEAVYAELAR
jgi:glycosyltransferase involved in cell wall biosynthesis